MIPLSSCPRCGGTNFEKYTLSLLRCERCGALLNRSELVTIDNRHRFKNWLKSHWDAKAANEASCQTLRIFFTCAFRGVGYGFGFTTGVVMFFAWCKLISIIFGL